MDEILDQDEIDRRERRRKLKARRLLKLRLLGVWTAAVTLYFLWEAWAYRGLYAMFAEWQFSVFGHYLPIVTYTLLVLLFGVPALVLTRQRKSRYKRGSAKRGPDFALGTAMQFRRFLLGFAGGLGIASLATMFFSLTLPSIKPPERSITVGAPDSVAPGSGPATLKGRILYTRTSAFTQDMLVTRRGARFAPVMAPGNDGQSIRYFVELPPTASIDPAAIAAESSPPQNGVLMRNALPGSIVQLYGYAGYRVEQPYYVLYTSDRTMRWSYYVTAAQLGFAALIVLGAAMWQQRRVRQVRETLAERTATA